MLLAEENSNRREPSTDLRGGVALARHVSMPGDGPHLLKLSPYTSGE